MLLEKYQHNFSNFLLEKVIADFIKNEYDSSLEELRSGLIKSKYLNFILKIIFNNKIYILV